MEQDIGDTASDFIKFWTDKMCKIKEKTICNEKNAHWDGIIHSCLQLQPNNRAKITELLKSPFYEMIQGILFTIEFYYKKLLSLFISYPL